ncbi:hypothetical protein [Nocardioides sp. W7]|uniref:SCO7613 C-terminal domain-containing membrane protein n=1 Tax=Nocardioides sp. W7 TaxID=2931390 RepID=UPI001FD41CD6|nr:hypothetical protein [Nocardioides sp. W7]
MPFYDPTRCPDCGADLPAVPSRCDACDLPLTGQTAVQLQSVLRYADQLLGQLRRPAPSAIAPYPAPAPRERERRGPRTTSVPAVLLGLGALCLLVAALIFLAVAWSWLGVGGRTTVLLGLTAGSAAAGLVLGGRGLRAAGEALTVVALGLVLLDVAGAGRAGWLGTHPDGVPLAVYGGALAVAGLALLTHPSRLIVPQLAAATGVGVLLAGLGEQTDRLRLLAFVGVLAFAALAWTGRALRAAALRWLALAGAGVSWLVLAGTSAAHALEDPTLAGQWADGRVAGLLAAAALLLLPAAFRPLRPVALEPCLALAAAAVTGALAVPVVDETATVLVLVASAVVVAWSGVLLLLLGSRWSLVAQVPLLIACVPVAGATITLGLLALSRTLDIGTPYSATADVRLAARLDQPHPLVLPIAALTIAVAIASLVPRAHRRTAAARAAGPLGLAGLGGVALFAAPLAAVVLPLSAAGAAVLLVRRVRTGLLGLVAVAAAGAAVPLALPSAGLTTATAVVLSVVAASVALRGPAEVRLLGGAALPLALATAAWAGGEVAGLDPSYRSLLVLALVAALALPRPRPEVELAAVVAAVAAALAGIDDSTPLAVHLTLAGALLTIHSLLHRDRRPLAWPGGLLLAAATWVRLAEIGVEAPEAYTLPSAVALVLVGLYRLTRDGRAGTATALLPGLVLATVPSLLWVLADPLTPRAVLLGAGCLTLVLLGARLGWSAPLLVGGTVGALVVLRESAPYLAETPQWILIGTAGALLTVVGVTWERRSVELHRAGAYVGRLR